MLTPQPTHRLLSSSFSGLPYRILNISHKKELLRSLWVNLSGKVQEASNEWADDITEELAARQH